MSLEHKPVHGMNNDEIDALNKWASDFRKAGPAMQGLANTAKAIHRDMIGSPVWRVAEGQPEAGRERPTDQDPWSIGAPKVNYVDHIETLGDSDGSPAEEGDA